MPNSSIPINRFTGQTPRVVGAYLRTAVETAAEQGVSPAALATAIGLPVDGLDPLPEALPVPHYLRLLNAAAELANDAAFGLHVGERMRLATYAVYGIIVLACRTFGDAIATTMRYESLAHDLGRSQMAVAGDVAEYVWQSPWLADTPCPHLPESVFAGIKTFADWLAGRPMPAIEIGFAHAAVAPESEYRRLFGAPVKFGVDRHYARFPAALLELPLPNADPSLLPVLQKHADALLEARGGAAMPDVVVTVREHIARDLAAGRAVLQEVAAALNVTPRTLQRRLAEAGTSFQEEVDVVRRELTRQYLARPELTLTDVAFLLGFQSQSSFNHAFKGWTGENPGGYRSRLAASRQPAG